MLKILINDPLKCNLKHIFMYELNNLNTISLIILCKKYNIILLGT